MKQSIEEILKRYGRHTTTTDVMAEPAEPYVGPWHANSRLTLTAQPKSVVTFTLEQRDDTETITHTASIDVHRSELYFLWSMAPNYTERCYTENAYLTVAADRDAEKNPRYTLTIKKRDGKEWADAAEVVFGAEVWDEAAMVMRAISEAQTYYENSRVREQRDKWYWQLMLDNMKKDAEHGTEARKAMLDKLIRRIELHLAERAYDDYDSISVYFLNDVDRRTVLAYAYAEFTATYPMWIWMMGWMLTTRRDAHGAQQIQNLVRKKYTRKHEGPITIRPQVDYAASFREALRAYQTEKGAVMPQEAVAA